MEELFGIDNFNVISDDDYYYVFRALNMGDHSDLEKKITSEDGLPQRIRTDRLRWEEEHNRKSRFSESSSVSAEEIISHCKAINHSKETNCISLTSNANIVINYGNGYHDEYIMVRIPKRDKDGFIDAGRYLLEVLEKYINETIASLDKTDELLPLLERIDDIDTPDIINSVVSCFQKVKSEGKFTGRGSLKDRYSVKSRFEKKQIFSKEQQRKYTILIAKLTLLEINKKVKPILKNTRDNTLFLKTMSTIFSNTEILHYNELQSDQFTKISKTVLDMFALIQQINDNDRTNGNFIKLKDLILSLAKNGYDIDLKDGRILLTNGEREIDVGSEEGNILFQNRTQEKEFDIEYIYKLTRWKYSI